MSVQQNINWQQVNGEQLLWELRSLISKRYHKLQDVSENAWQSIADAAYNITAFLYQKGNQVVVEDPYSTTIDSVFDVKYILYLSKKLIQGRHNGKPNQMLEQELKPERDVKESASRKKREIAVLLALFLLMLLLLASLERFSVIWRFSIPNLRPNDLHCLLQYVE
ncbi:hypothetical protein MP228_003127 [Amoeboaphelidium protococcarum]|nr:hypothetical protein MP228_003127 [Amoeboaphelidium protococcarum]